MLANTQPLWIRGGRVIDTAQHFDGLADILIVDGTVYAFGTSDEVASAVTSLEQQGRSVTTFQVPADAIVTPGFIDLHVHLREPGYEARETIRSGTLAAVQGGYTTICCMPNTNPVLDNRGTLEWITGIAASLPARVLPIAAITQRQEGTVLTEMTELSDAGAVAFSDDGKPVRSSGMMRLALTYALNLDRPIVNHCEDPDIVGKGVMNEGAIATRLGLRGWPISGETIMLARDLELTRLTGSRYHAAHLSSVASVELVRRAKQEGLRVTAEVTPHHLLLTDAWVAGEREGVLAGANGRRYDTSTKVNPPLRTLSDTQALIEGVKDGTIDVIATDHAPHSDVEKVCTYDEAAFGISGLETALGGLFTLVHQQQLTLTQLIASITSAPAQAFHLTERVGQPVGTLATGASGDVAIIQPQHEWTVTPHLFASQGHNTPLEGVQLRGKVVATIAAGNIVYKERS